ncbi:MAG TPA: S53 family peptidase [Holophagaceae bacterium]|nr:S53 family peptidase [Holophagaceae bacterium]
MSQRTLLSGHLRPSVSGATPSYNEEELRVTVVLRSKVEREAASLHALGAQCPQGREHLTREAFAEAHGADPADLEALRAFASSHGLVVTSESLGGLRVKLSGSAADLAKAFHLRWGTLDGHRVSLDEPSLPSDLAPRVRGILGLDTTPRVRPHLQAMDQAQAPTAFPGFTPPELAQLYGFPDGDGAGQCVGILELGGGYDAADLEAYFQALSLPVPEITVVSVGGQTNNPTGCTLPERQEVTLDIQVVGAIVPRAKLVVYFAPNTNEGMLDAIDAALHDTVNKPSVISLSWGGAEGAAWNALEAELVSDALKSAASLGVTVFASSGDYGSSDQISDGKAHVNFPAASPWVVGCGGTTLVAQDGAIVSEKAWNNAPDPGATGGGVSEAFELPDWQKDAKVPPCANDGEVRRGVPDLAANADMNTGYRMFVAGQWQMGGGTSAVAPLMAGLVARLNQALGKPCGFLNPILYTNDSVRAALRPITEGDNGAYTAGPGYNACTGLGVPVGEALLAALKG